MSLTDSVATGALRCLSFRALQYFNYYYLTHRLDIPPATLQQDRRTNNININTQHHSMIQSIV